MHIEQITVEGLYDALRGTILFDNRTVNLHNVILEWTTRLDTSSRTLFVREGGREGGRMSVRMSTSRRTSSYVITSDCY